MIPLKNSIPSRTFPVVNLLIIAANIALFVYQLSLPREQLLAIINTYGVVPASLLTAPTAGDLFSLGAAAFLHGSWMHLIGNMLYLWVFGDNVEDAMGHIPYLFYYLFAGGLASLSHAMVNPGSTSPLIGASGAIAGVLGSYFVLYPRSKVLAFVPLFFFLTLARVPAVLFLVLWFVLQLFNALVPTAEPGVNMVAWWAHIGGFVFGIIAGVYTRLQGKSRHYL